jgi:hypothetical protein
MTIHESTTNAWKIILSDISAEGTKKAVSALSFAAAAILDDLEPGATISTTELGERIWPKSPSRGDHETLRLRKRMFSLLLQTGQNVILPNARRRTDSAYTNRYGVETHPWEWFNPAVTAKKVSRVGLATPMTSAQQAMDQLLTHYGVGQDQRDRVLHHIDPTQAPKMAR